MNGLFAGLAGLLASIPGFGPPPEPLFTGYVEARYVYVAPASAGIIDRFEVAEGQAVRAGEPLFVQRTAQFQALYDAASAQVEAARASWRNLLTGGRPEELAAAQAVINKSQSDLTLAQATLARAQKLFASNTITQAQLDQDTEAVATARAALAQAVAQKSVTALPAREEQQKAAQANLAAAIAAAAKARADLDDRSVTAPVSGRVERIFYDAGEMASAGAPVVSILPANAMKVEFYVAEPDRMTLAMGQQVHVACDGCGKGMTARISFMASEPQYTSPLIYSRDVRATLVYLAEATIDNPANVLPGQPVTVSLGHD
jgi:HlyD family secretion protein